MRPHDTIISVILGLRRCATHCLLESDTQQTGLRKCAEGPAEGAGLTLVVVPEKKRFISANHGPPPWGFN